MSKSSVLLCFFFFANIWCTNANSDDTSGEVLNVLLEKLHSIDSKFDSRMRTFEKELSIIKNPPKPLTFKMPGTRKHLAYVLNTLMRLGYEETEGSDWDLLWSFRYPWGEGPESAYASAVQDLKKFGGKQKVNHWPNIAYMVSKELLGACQELRMREYGEVFDIAPRTYILPEQFKQFEIDWKRSKEKHADKIAWIKKGKTHRLIEFLPTLESAKQYDNALAQKYVHSHLIDGHKFDIGIYVAITSIEPLRLYVFDDVLVRICKHKYPSRLEDFATNLEAWIVDDYLPIWDFPSIEKFYDKNNMEAMVKYFLSVDPVRGAQVFPEMYHRIRMSVLSIRSRLIDMYRDNVAKSGGKTRNSFFEMVRFDFLIDKDLTPWVTEVNMSPNLVLKNEVDGKMKQLLVDSLFTLVGLNTSRNEETQFVEPTLYDNATQCTEDCGHDCPEQCMFCPSCLSTTAESDDWKKLQVELTRKTDHMKLIYPMHNMSRYDAYQTLSQCPLPSSHGKKAAQKKAAKKGASQSTQTQERLASNVADGEVDFVFEIQQVLQKRFNISLKLYEWIITFFLVLVIRKFRAWQPNNANKEKTE